MSHFISSLGSGDARDVIPVPGCPRCELQQACPGGSECVGHSPHNEHFVSPKGTMNDPRDLAPKANAVQLNAIASFVMAVVGDNGYLPLSVRFEAANAALRVVDAWKEKGDERPPKADVEPIFWGAPASDFDPRDLAPKGRRAQPDRRQGPRREDERVLHYTEQALVAAALQWADDIDWADSRLEDRLLAHLRSAVERYRAAVAAIYERRSDG